MVSSGFFHPEPGAEEWAAPLRCCSWRKISSHGTNSPQRSIRVWCSEDHLHQVIWENPRKIIVFAAWRIYELTMIHVYIYIYICIRWSYWSAWLFTLFCVAAVAQFFRQVPKRSTIPDRRRTTSTNRINAGHLSHGEMSARWIRVRWHQMNPDHRYTLSVCMYVW